MFPHLLRDFSDPCDQFSIGFLMNTLKDDFMRPRNVYFAAPTSGKSHVTWSTRPSETKFKVMINVKNFRPEEVDIKTVDDFVVIHAKHEEQADEHGFVSREFTRRYKLPDDAEPESVKSSLTRNGILTVHATKKVLDPPPKNERIVPIVMQQPVTIHNAQALQEQSQNQGGDMN